MHKLHALPLVLAALLALPQDASAACTVVELNSVFNLEPPEKTKALAVWLDEEPGRKLDVLPTPVEGTNLPAIGEADLALIKKVVKANTPKRDKLRLAYVDDKGQLLKAGEVSNVRFALADGDRPGAVEACKKDPLVSVALQAKAAPTVAPALDICSTLVTKEQADEPHTQWVVFNSQGQSCALSYPVGQGDLLRVGLALSAGEPRPQKLSLIPTGCTKPTGAPVVVGKIDPNFLKQSGKDGPKPTPSTQATVSEDTLLKVGMPLECASDSVKVKLKIDDVESEEITLQLFSRTTALVHVGVLNTKLREPEFGLRTDNGSTVITDKEAQSRGPEYVATVVIQGLPHYLRKGFSYRGRDLVHDNGTLDRIGLAFGFGLKNPTKRFGMGLSYEVTKGVNVVAMHEWVKRTRLDGVKLGDTFAGAAGDIPTSREWAKGWAFGVTFDTAYITSAFGSK
ncbi:MAG: hypothetical protein H7Z15_05210 [Rhizobacter sp.]|nr:hypothetical protein [Rhizobacter sp.]